MMTITQKIQLAIPTVSKALDEIVAQEYEIVEHNLGRNTDDMECEEIQEGVASIRERLRKANERIKRLETNIGEIASLSNSCTGQPLLMIARAT